MNWISVSEKLPEDNSIVLVTAVNCVGNKFVAEARFNRYSFELPNCDEVFNTVLAWCEMPKPF